MRHGASGRRSRNRGGNRRGNQNRSQVFDSNGPDVRIRGTAHQIHEKYIALAKDAAGTGDRIMEQSYLQHAEHYQRVINSWNDDTKQQDNRIAATPDNKAREEKPAPQDKAPYEKDRAKTKGDNLGLPESITKAGAKNEELEDA